MFYSQFLKLRKVVFLLPHHISLSLALNIYLNIRYFKFSFIKCICIIILAKLIIMYPIFLTII
jgi:hypothetical protein